MPSQSLRFNTLIKEGLNWKIKDFMYMNGIYKVLVKFFMLGKALEIDIKIKVATEISFSKILFRNMGTMPKLESFRII